MRQYAADARRCSAAGAGRSALLDVPARSSRDDPIYRRGLTTLPSRYPHPLYLDRKSEAAGEGIDALLQASIERHSKRYASKAGVRKNVMKSSLVYALSLMLFIATGCASQKQSAPPVSATTPAPSTSAQAE